MVVVVVIVGVIVCVLVLPVTMTAGAFADAVALDGLEGATALGAEAELRLFGVVAVSFRRKDILAFFVIVGRAGTIPIYA